MPYFENTLFMIGFSSPSTVSTDKRWLTAEVKRTWTRGTTTAWRRWWSTWRRSTPRRTILETLLAWKYLWGIASCWINRKRLYVCLIKSNVNFVCYCCKLTSLRKEYSWHQKSKCNIFPPLFLQFAHQGIWKVTCRPLGLCRLDGRGVWEGNNQYCLHWRRQQYKVREDLIKVIKCCSGSTATIFVSTILGKSLVQSRCRVLSSSRQDALTVLR